MIVISEERAVEQLRNLIEPIHALPVQWSPFSNINDDYDCLQWVRHEDNDWCSGKKEDFKLFAGELIHYQIGNYAKALLLVLGIKTR